jgi:hypothetical protein
MRKSGHKDVRSGCFQCFGPDAHWQGSKARAIAQRHAKAKDHSTWVEVIKSVTYNPEAEFRKPVSLK